MAEVTPLHRKAERRKAKRHRPEPSIVLRMVREDDGKLIAAAHLKRVHSKMDRFSLIAMREVSSQVTAEEWARNIARAGRVEQVEIEEVEDINPDRPVTSRRASSQRA